MSELAPRVFISYSHDSQEHKDWVLTLATRLLANGVDVVLDQWDLALGSDLPQFMEAGLTSVQRVLAICSDPYVTKANKGVGGVGYEKMILTASLMRSISDDKVIPVIRNNLTDATPTFLASKLYIDFRDDSKYESKYAELIRDIHGQKIKPRPPLGSNPFNESYVETTPKIAFSSERYASPALSGSVKFDYSNNDGRYVVGSGDMAFETAWSRASNQSIHAVSDRPSVRTIALAAGVKEISEIQDAGIYDTSSRVRSPHLGEIVVWRNTAGYYLATRIDALKSRGHGDAVDEVSFSYDIAPSKLASFKR